MTTTESPAPDRRALRRRIRAIRAWLGPGPYLHAGCGTGMLLARLAECGSAAGWEPDPLTAAAARRAAPGCPVHTELSALPAGVFRGVVLDRPIDGDLAAGLLAPDGRVLLTGDLPVPSGFAVTRTGRERRWSGAPVRLLRSMVDGGTLGERPFRSHPTSS